MNWDCAEITSIIDAALKEDLDGAGDITTKAILREPRSIQAFFLAKQAGILAGFPLLPRIFKRLDAQVAFQESLDDGAALIPGKEICKLHGDAAALLAGERVALNFLQRLSGIATQTAVFARQAAPFGIAVLDTRKTTPLLRVLEKYAVTVGGGKNHRIGLFDGVLVKDNHLKVQSDFSILLKQFRDAGFSPLQVEIEVTDQAMLERAIAAGVLHFLLDNMSPDQIRSCVQLKRSGMFFEVSGGISAENFPDYLIRGVDAISIGALTHSVKSLDISMEMVL